MTEQERFVDKVFSNGRHAIIAAITTVCPVANGVYQYMSAIETENLTKLVNDIKERVERLETDAEANFMERGRSEYGEGLLKYSFIKAARCHRKEQIDKMVDIVISALGENKISESEAEVLIDIVGSLNVEEGEFLSEIYREFCTRNENAVLPKYLGPEWTFSDPFVSPYNAYNKKAFSLYNRLIGKGLLEELNVGASSWKYVGTEFESDTVKEYRFTHYGQLYIKIIYNIDV